MIKLGAWIWPDLKKMTAMKTVNICKKKKFWSSLDFFQCSQIYLIPLDCSYLGFVYDVTNATSLNSPFLFILLENSVSQTFFRGVHLLNAE